MFTRNWYKSLGHHIAGFSTNKASTVVTLSGTENDLLYPIACVYGGPSAYCAAMDVIPTGIAPGVWFGSGNTPTTLDDYCLSGSRVTTFKAVTSLDRSVDEDGMTCTATYTITNTASEPITIAEIGLVAKRSVSGSGNGAHLLLERTVLDSPLTIPAGGVGQVTYTIRMNYPTA